MPQPSTAYKRMIVAQALYNAAALLYLINTCLSITVTILIQLNYALAPGFRRRPVRP